MKLRYLFIAAAIAIPAVYAWRFFASDNGPLLASGTIEARNIKVGSKEGGRVREILAHEGDRVEAGQLLVTFDSEELEGRLMQARGHLALAKANLEKMERGSRPEEIAEARAATGGDRETGFRAAEVAQTQADLERAGVEAANARRNYDRARDLRERNLGSQQALDDAETGWRAAEARVRSLQQGLAAAQARLEAARAVTTRVETGSRREDIDAARGEMMRAEGALKEAEARWAEREVRSPAAAVIEVLDLRPGDLVQPGAVVARLLETEQLYVIVYVPETRIGEVESGQQVDLQVDSFPGTVFRAHVEQVRQQAEFLPRNVQTPEERVHQVIGVKLHVEDPDRRLRAGMSADVTFAAGRAP
ncbi:MAG: efflux RND transporter periplasmic adaptor subunit [Gammaproteobacteria bacterium]|nr:efflux RND transporter periplasmic adaptor subunit [Gammaproteobacteria bacterium]